MFFTNNLIQKRATVFDAPSNRYAYSVPRETKSLFIWCVGGGGNGGTGAQRAANGAGGGGGGGSHGAIGYWYGPAFILPDTIYINVGGSNTTTFVYSLGGVTGGTTQICFGNGGGNGNNGTTGNIGAGGASVGGGAIQNIGPYMSGVLFVNTVTTVGGGGGAIAGANGTTVTYGTNGHCVGPGAGGAGCTTTDFNGGDIVGGELFGTIPGGVGAGVAGAPGYINWDIMQFSGGAGGASNNTGVGGAGGNGGPGCGGGGGGVGATAGAGGRGGNGFAVILPIF